MSSYISATASLRSNRKAFLLGDCLVSLVVILELCLLCLSLYRCVFFYEEGYEAYVRRREEDLLRIYASLPFCEGCIEAYECP